MDGEVSGRALGTEPLHGAIHGPDDVPAGAEVAQRLLHTWLERPHRGAMAFGETEPLQCLRPTDHQPAEFGIGSVSAAGAQVQDAGLVIGGGAQGTVETGPTLGTDFRLQRAADLLLGPRPEFQLDQCLGAATEAARDVVTRDHQVTAILGPAAHQDMDVGVVGVPVIDPDPVEAAAQILLGLAHQVARPSLEVREGGRVLWADDEAEVVAVIRTALREVSALRIVGAGVEEPRLGAITGHPVPLEVADVGGEGSGPEARALMAHDARLDHDASRG